MIFEEFNGTIAWLIIFIIKGEVYEQKFL